jgi:hypothetical protein
MYENFLHIFREKKKRRDTKSNKCKAHTKLKTFDYSKIIKITI